MQDGVCRFLLCDCDRDLAARRSRYSAARSSRPRPLAFPEYHHAGGRARNAHRQRPCGQQIRSASYSTPVESAEQKSNARLRPICVGSRRRASNGKLVRCARSHDRRLRRRVANSSPHARGIRLLQQLIRRSRRWMSPQPDQRSVEKQACANPRICGVTYRQTASLAASARRCAIALPSIESGTP
jgi:hypothetical protein